MLVQDAEVWSSTNLNRIYIIILSTCAGSFVNIRLGSVILAEGSALSIMSDEYGLSGDLFYTSGPASSITDPALLFHGVSSTSEAYYKFYSGSEVAEGFNFSWNCVAIGGAGEETPCPKGSYSDSIGADKCELCPAGSICPSIATISPIPCSRGSYSDSGALTCNDCNATVDYGTYYCDSGGRRLTCPAASDLRSLCPSQTGSSSSLVCPAGFSANATATIEACTHCLGKGGNFCLPCAEGTYKSPLNETCLSCEAGSSCPHTVAREVTPLEQVFDDGGPEGDYSLNPMARLQRLNCSEGYMVHIKVNFIAFAENTLLGFGTQPTQYSGILYQTYDDYPIPPLYSDKDRTSLWEGIAPTNIAYYWFSASGDTSERGFEFSWNCVTVSGAVTQSKCGKGTFASKAGSASCSRCTAGHYCPTDGLVEPVPCPDGFYSALGAVLLADCVPCEAGFYCRRGSRRSCVGDAGAYCPKGSSSPSFCPPGTASSVWDAKDDSVCSACPTGTVAGEAEGKCSPCPVGRYCPTPAIAVPCSHNQYLDTAGHSLSQDCKSCGEFEFAMEGSDRCFHCSSLSAADAVSLKKSLSNEMDGFFLNHGCNVVSKRPSASLQTAAMHTIAYRMAMPGPGELSQKPSVIHRSWDTSSNPCSWSFINCDANGFITSLGQ